MEEDITICRVCGAKLKKDGLCDNCGWIRIIMPQSAPKALLDLRSRSIDIMKERLQQINEAQETETLKSQVESLTARTEELAVANNALRAETEQLAQANQSLRSEAGQLAEANNALNDKIKALTEANEAANNKLKALSESNDSLTKACDEKDKTILNQKEAFKPAITKIKDLTSALEEAEAKIKELSNAPQDGLPKLVGMVRIIDRDGQELWMTVMQGKNVYGTEPSEATYPDHHRHTVYNIISNAEGAFMPEHFIIEAGYDTFHITDLSGTMKINGADIQPNTKYNDMGQGITMDSDGEHYDIIVKLV